MSISLKKKKIISLFLLAVILTGSFLVWNDLNSEKSTIKKISKVIENKTKIFAQELPYYFMPRFPRRLMYLASEIAGASQEMTYLNEELNRLNQGCSCGSVRSYGSKWTFGDPCPAREKIEEKQREIEDKVTQLSHLQNLLKKEMESGLERELATLREDVAKELKTNLENLLALSQNMTIPARDNQALPSQCSIGECQAYCLQEKSFKIEACFGFIGEQKPMEAIFEVGTNLKDLKLGEVKIKNINLGLPEKIQTPDLPELSSFIIPLADQTLVFPEVPIAELQENRTLDISGRPIIFHPPSVILPGAPLLELSCPGLPNYSSSNQWLTAPEKEPPPINYVELENYFQAFDELKEKCLGLPGMKEELEAEDEYGELIKFETDVPTGKAMGCYSPGTVYQTIVRECDNLWQAYYLAQEEEEEELPIIPSICQPEELEELEELSSPGALTYSPSGTSLTQKIGDFPQSILGCPASPPTIPRITFPKIEIPDILLPRFRLWPFFDIKLPNFVIEDLKVPDIELCNLDACLDIFPALKFQLPALFLPPVSVPAIEPETPEVFIEDVGTVKVPLPEIELTAIPYPPLPFNFFQLFNLANLLTPELELPGIPLPQLGLNLAFKGLNINLFSLLLGLLPIPDIPTTCLKLGLGIPLRIDLGEFYFGWPGFPEIPQIPYCQNVQDFCQKTKTSLKDVIDKTGEIEKIVSQTFQKEIQEKLDQAAPEINQEIAKSIEEQLNQRAQKIKEEVEKHIRQKARREKGLLKIPALSIPMENIVVPSISLAEKLNLPKEIIIAWPERLKKIALTEAITYQLPDIPLSFLNYQKEIRIKIPGLQLPSATVSLTALENYPACLSGPAQTPIGADPPCPTSQIRSNFETIKQQTEEIKETSKNIINILE